jgi:hypothetical protein
VLSTSKLKSRRIASWFFVIEYRLHMMGSCQRRCGDLCQHPSLLRTLIAPIGRRTQSFSAALRQQTKAARARGNRKGNLCSQTSIDCWAKIPAIAPCDDARVTDGGVMGLARSPAA